MVTLRQLKLERKKAFRLVHKSLNVVQKQLNFLERELVRRLRKHGVELLDVDDAIKIGVESQKLWQLTDAYVKGVAGNLDAFFR